MRQNTTKQTRISEQISLKMEGTMKSQQLANGLKTGRYVFENN